MIPLWFSCFSYLEYLFMCGFYLNFNQQFFSILSVFSFLLVHFLCGYEKEKGRSTAYRHNDLGVVKDLQVHEINHDADFIVIYFSVCSSYCLLSFYLFRVSSLPYFKEIWFNNGGHKPFQSFSDIIWLHNVISKWTDWGSKVT